MKVIEKMEQFIEFSKLYALEEKVIILPIFADHKRHPLNNNLSLLYVRFFSGDRFILVFDHPEGLSLDPKCIDTFRKYDIKILTSDKKILSHVFSFSAKIFDINIIRYLAGKDVSDSNYETITHHVVYNSLRLRPFLNRIVPIVKHFENYEEIADNIFEIHTLRASQTLKLKRQTYCFYNDIVIPVFTKIEKAGLKTQDKYFYSEYNLYTSTGRPSNRFGGINFAALNKTDGSRKKFISRFKDGGLLLFDYSAYHLRLIADVINFDLPSDNTHTFLGRQYFDKDDLTDDEYSESKLISFKFLYGETPADIAEAIPYFGAVKKYVDKLWDEINTVGYIESPISGRRIYKDKINSINSTKLFNYQIQLLETEQNCLTLVKIQEFLEEYETKLILYTYDSFLFDINMNDGKDFFKTLQSVIECAGRFPTKTYIGKNYDELKYVNF